ncbi:hypothetical protein WJX73_003008 [Symbiochloris irregularis]|uniref:CxC3 like cysteine cluster domain-containing protein n=1 Tax=Symbiochloris irregularis TaxID=706552 RepID=A0AAW1NUE6_9CHLO
MPDYAADLDRLRQIAADAEQEDLEEQDLAEAALEYAAEYGVLRSRAEAAPFVAREAHSSRGRSRTRRRRDHPPAAESPSADPTTVAAEPSEQHQHAHFHVRHHPGSSGYWKPLPPQQNVTAEGNRIEAAKCINVFPVCCTSCQQTDNQWTLEGPAQLIILYHRGRHHFHLPQCRCLSCDNLQATATLDLQCCGLWPATPEAPKTFIDERSLLVWHILKHNMPQCSLQGYIAYMNVQTAAWGPSKGSEEHGRIVELARSGAPSEDNSALCGGLWTAARETGSRHEKMHITGRFFAVCKHGIPHRACNLIGTGEKFFYSHLMRTDYCYQQQPYAISHDVNCMYSTWEQRTNQAILGSSDPDVQGSAAFHRVQATAERAACVKQLLPDMHAKVHAWPCRTKFGPDFTPDIGIGSGEQCEQLFAELYRWAPSTKHMSAAGSTDALTGAAIHIGTRKRHDQAADLSRRYKQAERELHKVERTLDRDCADLLGQPASQCTERLAELEAALQRLGAEHSAASRVDATDIVKLVKCNQEVVDTERLYEAQFPGLGETIGRLKALRLIASDGDLNLSSMHAMAVQAHQQLQGARDRRDRLWTQILLHSQGSTGQQLEMEALLDMSIPQVVDVHIEDRHRRIEAAVAHRNNQRRLLLNEAVGAQEQQRYNKRLRKATAGIKELVNELDCLRAHGSAPATDPTDVERVLAAEFPWVATGVNDDGLLGLGVYEAMRLHAMASKVRRNKEELPLLRKEMGQYLRYVRAELQRIQAAIGQASGQLHQLDQAQGAARPRYRLLQATSRYQLYSEDVQTDDLYLRGQLALFHEAKEEFENLMAQGTSRFGRHGVNVAEFRSFLQQLGSEEAHDEQG